MSIRLRRWTAALLGLVLLVSACDDDDDDNGTGPEDELTPAEAGVLADALVQAGFVDGQTAALVGVVLASVIEVGSMNVPAPVTLTARPGLSLSLVPAGGDYEAIAFQIDLSFNGEPQEAVSGLLGWRGLDVETGDVAELVLWSIESEPPPPTSVSATFDLLASGQYWEDATQSSYEANSGTATVSNAAFTTSTFDCSGSYSGIPIECTGQDGDMTGSFGFGAELISGTGAATTTWPTTTFNIPAVRLTVDATLTQP